MLVAYSIVTSLTVVWSKVTVKVAVPSVSPTVWLDILINGSPSTITKSAVVVSPVIVALAALFKVRVAVSSAVSSASVKIGTSIVPLDAPELIVSVPVAPA